MKMSGTVEESWSRVGHNPDGSWAVLVSLGGSPLHTALKLEEQAHGGSRELVCTQAIIEPTNGVSATPVTTAGMRELAANFDQIMRVAAAAVGAHSEGGGQIGPAPRARRTLSPAFLRDVSRRYADYENRGLPPVATLAREEQVSKRTVLSWLQKARAA